MMGDSSTSDLNDCRDILIQCYGEPLYFTTQCTYNTTSIDAQKIIEDAAEHCILQPKTALELLPPAPFLPNCSPLEQLLHGVIPDEMRGMIIEVVGEAGSGKTNLCYILSAKRLLDDSNAEVVWIDTESKFDVFRLVAIMRSQLLVAENEMVKNVVNENISLQNRGCHAFSMGHGNTTLPDWDNLILQACARLHILFVETLEDIVEVIASLSQECVKFRKFSNPHSGTISCPDIDSKSDVLHVSTEQTCCPISHTNKLLIIDSVAAAVRTQNAQPLLNAVNQESIFDTTSEDDVSSDVAVDSSKSLPIGKSNIMQMNQCIEKKEKKETKKPRGFTQTLEFQLCEKLKRLGKRTPCTSGSNTKKGVNFDDVGYPHRQPWEVVVVNHITTVIQEYVASEVVIGELIVPDVPAVPQPFVESTYDISGTLVFSSKSGSSLIKPALGLGWHHAVNIRLLLSSYKAGVRTLYATKAPMLGSSKTDGVDFKIVEGGNILLTDICNV